MSVTEIKTNSTELARVIGGTELSPERTQAIVETFSPIFIEADKVIEDSKAIVVTDESQKEAMKQARTARLTLKDIRVRSEKVHKEMKQDALRFGQALDLVKRTIVGVIETEEARLEECEKFAERREAERRAQLIKERTQALAEFDADPAMYKLGEMTEEQFATLVDSLRITKERRLEEERKAEEDRKAAEAARLEEERKIREDNERLRKEREEREAEMKAERERLEAEKKAAEAQARKEREERERVEAEQRRQREAEEAARREAELAPDKQKIMALAQTIREIEIPSVTSKPAKAAITRICTLMDRLCATIEAEAEAVAEEVR